MEKRKTEIMILIAIGSNLKSSLYGMPENNCLEVIKILRKYFFVVILQHINNFFFFLYLTVLLSINNMRLSGNLKSYKGIC